MSPCGHRSFECRRETEAVERSQSEHRTEQRELGDQEPTIGRRTETWQVAEADQQPGVDKASDDDRADDDRADQTEPVQRPMRQPEVRGVGAARWSCYQQPKPEQCSNPRTSAQ